MPSPQPTQPHDGLPPGRRLIAMTAVLIIADLVNPIPLFG